MKLTYTKITGLHYSHYFNEWYNDEEDFDYYVDAQDLIDALTEIIYSLEFNVGKFDEKTTKALKDAIYNFIDENELDEKLAVKYKEDLHEYFSDKAHDWYENSLGE